MGINVITNLEDKSLKEILKIWLFSKDQMEILRATIEMRRRFLQTYREE